MFIAVDRTTGREVRADDAAVRRWSGRRYLCPLCRKSVVLRVGRRYSSYFAHKTGVGTEDCENYHSGGEQLGGPHGPVFALPRPLSIYLRTIEPGVADWGNPIRVRLEVGEQAAIPFLGSWSVPLSAEFVTRSEVTH